MDCIFCKIVNGEIPSYCVYENEKVKAFLDINPMRNGHTLIIPKKHFENLYDMDIDTLIAIEEASKEVARKLKVKLNCDGITRFQNNEYGQEVKHYHMHLIPRHEGDNAHMCFGTEEKKDVEEVFRLIKND